MKSFLEWNCNLMDKNFNANYQYRRRHACKKLDTVVAKQVSGIFVLMPPPPKKNPLSYIIEFQTGIRNIPGQRRQYLRMT